MNVPLRSTKTRLSSLIYIVSGKGILHVNQNEFGYGPENLFLVMPMDLHYTEVLETTSFMFIRFNNIYLNAQKSREQYSNLGEWIHKLEYIFQNSNHLQGLFLRNAHDKPLVRAVMDAIVQEYVNQQTLHKELVQQLINTLITVVARNISLHVSDKHRDQPKHFAGYDSLTYTRIFTTPRS
jgi:hypothetical protein